MLAERFIRIFAAAVMVGLSATTTTALAACTAAERADLQRRIIGAWGIVGSSGQTMCMTLRYEKGGRLVQSAAHCANGSSGASIKHWEINESCQLVQTGAGEAGTPYGLHAKSQRELTVDAANGAMTLLRK